jgi:hypothetical protein
VLPDVLATNRLAGLVEQLRNDNVMVHIYPVVPRLTEPTVSGDMFLCTLEGPPGMHEILHSPELVAWTTVSTVMNETGKVDIAVALTPPVGACRTRLENVE